MFAAGFLAGAAVAAALIFWRRKRAAAELGRFFSFAAHEINTPITAINMTVLNLVSGVFGEVPKEQLQWLEMTREQLGRLNGMVGELRDFIHVQFQRDLSIQKTELAPAEAAEAALKAVQVGCQHANLPVRAEIEPGLPTVATDADRISRTLATLAFHARKFRVAGEIVIRARRAARGVELSVEFVGPKLSPAEAARSLELFYPAIPRADHSMTATGLGLGLPALLARRAGAELSIEAAPDGRTKLALLVPSKC